METGTREKDRLEGEKMKKLLEKYNELKSIILTSKKFDVRKDFHLFILLEEISTQINQMKRFKYLGLSFTPFKKLEGKDKNFFEISKRITNKNDTPKGWNWKEFYKEAKKNDAGDFDLFKVKGKVRIPSTSYLFYYKEVKK